jgi:hypothetical protein
VHFAGNADGSCCNDVDTPIKLCCNMLTKVHYNYTAQVFVRISPLVSHGILN